MVPDYDETVPETVAPVIVRAANEGIPVAAIARIVKYSFELVSRSLRGALYCGQISEMPKPDWPPGARWAERLPSVARTANPEDVEFGCKKFFKLTKLEAAFMVVLLRHDCVEKEKLHGVIEDQRARRPLRPDKQEMTDPKMVDVIVCKLRKKLTVADPEFKLTTSWGSGYYFEAPVKQAILRKIGEPYGGQDEAVPQAQGGGSAGGDEGSAVPEPTPEPTQH